MKTIQRKNKMKQIPVYHLPVSKNYCINIKIKLMFIFFYIIILPFKYIGIMMTTSM